LWRRAPTAAAKAGLAGLTRALAQEFAEHNINVNCVAPGPVNTVRSTPLTFDMKKIPLERFAEISEVTAMIRLLCGASGRYITGQTIHVNGGFYMNN
jgi:3-oxoacyl-[acyl-carrier protein] reductase